MAAGYTTHTQGSKASLTLVQLTANLTMLSPVGLASVWAMSALPRPLLAKGTQAKAVQHSPQPNQQCHSAQRNEERQDNQDRHCNRPVVKVVAGKTIQLLPQGT